MKYTGNDFSFTRTTQTTFHKIAASEVVGVIQAFCSVWCLVFACRPMAGDTVLLYNVTQTTWNVASDYIECSKLILGSSYIVQSFRISPSTPAFILNVTDFAEMNVNRLFLNNKPENSLKIIVTNLVWSGRIVRSPVQSLLPTQASITATKSLVLAQHKLITNSANKELCHVKI